MEINNLITRLRDIGADMPDTHTINQAADMLTVLQAENNKLQDELKRHANVIILYSECGATINGVVASENYCANDKAIEAWNRRYKDE